MIIYLILSFLASTIMLSSLLRNDPTDTTKPETILIGLGFFVLWAPALVYKIYKYAISEKYIKTCQAELHPWTWYIFIRKNKVKKETYYDHYWSWFFVTLHWTI